MWTVSSTFAAGSCSILTTIYGLKGVLRTTSVALLDKDKLSDKFIHLSNHCIQTEHEEYGNLNRRMKCFSQNSRRT